MNAMCNDTQCVCDPCLERLLAVTDESVRKEAWGAWYQRDLPVVYDFVRRRLWSNDRNEVAEDIAQEAFLIGFRLITGGRCPPQGNNLCGLLIGVAKNLISKAGRAQRRAAFSLDDEAIHATGGAVSEDTVLISDLRKTLASIVGMKSGRECDFDKDLVIALYVDGQTPRSLACAMRVSEEWVRLHAHRRIKRLARELHRQCGTEVSPKGVRLLLSTLEISSPQERPGAWAIGLAANRASGQVEMHLV